jgi:protein translocase SecG subunit
MKILTIFQIIVSVFLIVLVLLQKRGGLLSSPQLFVFSKRGLEKKVFYLTWVLGAIFLVLAILNLIL